MAVADAQGHYEFRAPNIAPGKVQVFVGNNSPTTVEIAADPFSSPVRRPDRPTSRMDSESDLTWRDKSCVIK